MRRSTILSTLVLLFSFSCFAAEPEAPAAPAAPVDASFDSLGGNTILLERARALEPEKDVSIVQSRVVDRRRRVEIAPEISSVFGGQEYVRTKSLGLNAHYHFNPRFSVGLKYNYTFNTLSKEGQRAMDNANADYAANPENPTYPYPDLDFVKDEAMALLSYYPLYGKINWFERSVVHFDLYAVGGYGQMTLKSGTASTYTAGGGIGLWVTQHFTTRFELRYQNYTAKYTAGTKDLDLTVGSMQMGWLL